ncbi:MAG: hypothetical protein OQK12_14895 [Motiliproteus sp.]|nr:hypothetical protein [Motiliproteus sp.]MCW9054332.1 hypothetical protein [Motiliproteus sp.]
MAKSLADMTGWDYIPECFDPLFEPGSTVSKYPQDLIEIFNHTLSYKVLEERKSPCFISDRSPVDLYNLWMSKGLWRFEEDTKKFYKSCKHYAS